LTYHNVFIDRQNHATTIMPVSAGKENAATTAAAIPNSITCILSPTVKLLLSLIYRLARCAADCGRIRAPPGDGYLALTVLAEFLPNPIHFSPDPANAGIRLVFGQYLSFVGVVGQVKSPYNLNSPEAKPFATASIVAAKRSSSVVLYLASKARFPSP
jgi:hypothetical protein